MIFEHFSSFSLNILSGIPSFYDISYYNRQEVNSPALKSGMSLKMA